MKNKNYGFNYSLEKKHQKPEDYRLGGAGVDCIAQILTGERKQYLPKGEIQDIGEEKFDCVSRGFNNNFETKFNWLLKKGLLNEHLKWFQEKGYITSNGFEFSDAFVAIKSGTTRQGNSLIAPIDAIHRYGLVPKSLLPQLTTFDEHHDPKRITPEIENLGKEFLEKISIKYERVYEREFVEFLKKDMIVVGGFAWPEPINGEYPKTGNPFNHSYLDFDLPAYMAFDNYIDSVDGDFIKKLASDYDQTDFGYRTIIEIKKKETFYPEKKGNWLVDIFISFLNALKSLCWKN